MQIQPALRGRRGNIPSLVLWCFYPVLNDWHSKTMNIFRSPWYFFREKGDSKFKYRKALRATKPQTYCSWIKIFQYLSLNPLVWHSATHRKINLSGNFYILENSLPDVSVPEDFAKVRAFTVCLHIFSCSVVNCVLVLAAQLQSFCYLQSFVLIQVVRAPCRIETRVRRWNWNPIAGACIINYSMNNWSILEKDLLFHISIHFRSSFMTQFSGFFQWQFECNWTKKRTLIVQLVLDLTHFPIKLFSLTI